MISRIRGSFCNYDETERFVLNRILEELENEYIEELKYVVRGRVLAPFQTKCIAYALINKKCIISADTGLGKTGIASGLINCVNQKQVGFHWVVICPAFNLVQTADELAESMYSSKVVSTNNQSFSIDWFINMNINDWDVAVISYEALTNMKLQEYLLSIREYVQGIIVDESQLVCNLTGTASQLLKSMSIQMEYMIMLTATPIRVNVGQFIKQIHMLDSKVFGSELSLAINYYTEFDEDYKPVGVRNLDRLLQKIDGKYISITRSEINLKGNYTVNPLLVTPDKDYTNVSRKDIPKLVKGDPDGCAVRALLQEVKDYKDTNLKGLIYVNLNNNKEMVKEYLTLSGISCEILDGEHTKTAKSKEEVKKRFREGELDCLITNLTVGLNLQCDYIVFYELTFDFKQMLGRGERGLKANDLFLTFIVVNDTEDVIIFYENVYNRAKLLGEVCGKDITEIEIAYKEIKRLKAENNRISYEMKQEEIRRQNELAEEEFKRRRSSLAQSETKSFEKGTGVAEEISEFLNLIN